MASEWGSEQKPDTLKRVLLSNSMESDKLLALMFWTLIHPIRSYTKNSLYMIRDKSPTSHFYMWLFSCPSDIFNLYAEYIMRNAGLDEA